MIDFNPTTTPHLCTLKTFIRQLRRHIAGALALGLCVAPPLRAATISWTNTAGGIWSVANNWSPHQVPNASDDAVITTPGGYTVSLDITATINSLTLGGASGQQILT